VGVRLVADDIRKDGQAKTSQYSWKNCCKSAGRARRRPAPPVGTGGGPHGVNIMEFVKHSREKTGSAADGHAVVVTNLQGSDLHRL